MIANRYNLKGKYRNVKVVFKQEIKISKYQSLFCNKENQNKNKKVLQFLQTK